MLPDGMAAQGLVNIPLRCVPLTYTTENAQARGLLGIHGAETAYHGLFGVPTRLLLRQ